VPAGVTTYRENQTRNYTLGRALTAHTWGVNDPATAEATIYVLIYVLLWLRGLTAFLDVNMNLDSQFNECGFIELRSRRVQLRWHMDYQFNECGFIELRSRRV
jgi:hypothetical protein